MYGSVDYIRYDIITVSFPTEAGHLSFQGPVYLGTQLLQGGKGLHCPCFCSPETRSCNRCIQVIQKATMAGPKPREFHDLTTLISCLGDASVNKRAGFCDGSWRSRLVACQSRLHPSPESTFCCEYPDSIGFLFCLLRLVVALTKLPAFHER